MTLLYIDGFETQDSERYNAGYVLGYSSSGTRFGYGYCVDISRPILQYNLGSAESTIITGHAIKTNSYEWANIFYSDGGSLTAARINLSATGSITVYRGGGTLVGSTAAGIFPTTAWFYLETKVVVHDTTGSIEVRVDGVQVYLATNIDTRPGTGTGIDSIQYYYWTTGSNRQVDDLYICNGSGSVNNDFLGDVRVATLTPNGNGASSQLVGSDGNSTDNYLLVDESPPNASDYVGGTTSGDKDSYLMTDLPAGVSSVLGIQQVARLTKTDAGAKSAKHLIRMAATNYTSASFVLGAAWTTHTYVRETNPNTGVAWTIANVDAHEAGIEIA
jgi:hypothetical protein